MQASAEECARVGCPAPLAQGASRPTSAPSPLVGVNLLAVLVLSLACDGSLAEQDNAPWESTDSNSPGQPSLDGATATPQGSGSQGPNDSGPSSGSSLPLTPSSSAGTDPLPTATTPGGGPALSDVPNATPLPNFEPATGMLRRLTRTQFVNAVRHVFGAELDANDLDADSWDGGFAVVGAAKVVTAERGVEQYQTAIERAVDQVFSDEARRRAFVGCEPVALEGDTCTRGFIEVTGRRAWRRPLETIELDRLVAVANEAGLELNSPAEGARWATVALFTSPNFLYRPELGAPRGDGSLRFSGYEMASRLAFLVWNSIPDDELLDRAEAGSLGTAQGVREAAARLLDAAAGRQAVGGFARELMRLDRINLLAKDPSLFPEHGDQLKAGMIRDMYEVWEALVFDDRASALELFSTTKVVVNSDLARVYGLDPTGLDSNTFEVRNLPVDSPRVGILGKAAFLALFANQKEGSPTLRGKFMREALMCITIPPPPADVSTVIEDSAEDDTPRTKRDRLADHREQPRCAACHSLMDPLGLPFENFDALGRYRTTDNGLPIDATSDFDGQPVADARELGIVMSSSDAVAQCLVRKYYSYAVGHEPRPVDAVVLADLVTKFETSGFDLRELVLDVVTHEAFSSVAPQLSAAEQSP